MKWEMETEEIEAVLERIWDLHDKISDAIHAISRAHFLKSVKTLSKSSHFKVHPEPEIGGYNRQRGFVFVKDFRAAEDDSAIAEAKSLNAIRTALENLEDQLEFFRTLQSQQRAEQDAALARLEQSRIILAMRLSDHRGKKYKVIEEALAFVGDVPSMPRSHSGENLANHKDKKSVLMQMLMSTWALAGKSLKLVRTGGVLGNAALFAISMLALLQLHQVAVNAETLETQDTCFIKKNGKNGSRMEIPFPSSEMNQFDVWSARG